MSNPSIEPVALDYAPQVLGTSVPGVYARENPQLIANLQLLRGIAAALVLTVHLVPLMTRAGIVFDGGFCRGGVDIFFVISGFIMQRIAEQRQLTPAGFVRDRVVRIVPVYLLATLMFFAAATLVPALAKPGTDLRFLIGSLLFLPQGDPPFYPMLYVGWTLNYEMYFYLLFALLLSTGAIGRQRVIAMGALLSIPVVLVQVLGSGSSPMSFYGDAIVLEFLIGMVLASNFHRLGKLPLLVAVLAIVTGVVGMVSGDRLMPFDRLLYYGVPAALIVLGALILERRGFRATSTPTLTLGAISYALYVTHPLTLSAFTNLAERVVPPHSPAAFMAIVLAVMVAVLVAYAVHRLFELPVARVLRGAHRAPSLVVESSKLISG